jgi:hypothetical protein
VDAYFALIDLETGQLVDTEKGVAHLQALGEQMTIFSGRIYQKLATNTNHATKWRAFLKN